MDEQYPHLLNPEKLHALHVSLLDASGLRHSTALDKGMDWAIEQQGEQSIAVVTQAGNHFATNQAFRAVVRHMMGPNLVKRPIGVYGPRVLDEGASWFERRYQSGDGSYYAAAADVDRFTSQDDNNFMDGASAAFSMQHLRRVGFGDSEDSMRSIRDWARHEQFFAEQIVYDPALAVHAVTGMGLRNMREAGRRDD